MIEIVVVTYNSEAPARPLSSRFAAAGGTVGRGDDNQFVLPDPKHHVSRRQASISSDGERHWITNLSQANPTRLNGVELASDVPFPLRAGDEISIGLYRLQARSVSMESAPPQIPAATQSALPPNVPPRSTPPMRAPVPEMASAMPVQVSRLTETHLERAAMQAAMQSLPQSVAIAAPPKASAADAVDMAAAALPADAQTLLQAFLDGAGIPSITLSSGLTPELMTMIGTLLATAIDGTVDLLSLRALVKREVNADVTMVVVRNNNPLKFLPDGATVLTQMLRKRMPGFMGPGEAMQDAYDDLHAHQLGMMAGMQATLADLHRQLDPLAIERNAAPGSAFERMLPAGRKARNWDRYCELHRQSGESLGNATQSMAGKAFLGAYERISEQYKDDAANER